MATNHALTRTSPKGKGQKFIGRCFKCGTENLPMEAVGWPCENPANLSRDDAIIYAITGSLDEEQSNG